MNDQIKATFHGAVSGQVAVGKGNTQRQTVKIGRTQVSQPDLNELRQLIAQLRACVADEADQEQREVAVKRVDELEEAITATKPDLTKMQSIKQWFGTHLPLLAGAVASVIVHPIVGKLVEAAGDMIASDFRRQFQ